MNRTLHVPVELARQALLIEEANTFLWDYLSTFNAQFSKTRRMNRDLPSRINFLHNVPSMLETASGTTTPITNPGHRILHLGILDSL